MQSESAERDVSLFSPCPRVTHAPHTLLTLRAHALQKCLLYRIAIAIVFVFFSVLYSASSLQHLTYRIVNFTKDGIPDYIQRRIFSNALRLWESAAGIEIRECRECRAADILISFVTRKHGDHYPFDREGGTLAHAFYPLTNKGKSQL